LLLLRKSALSMEFSEAPLEHILNLQVKGGNRIRIPDVKTTIRKLIPVALLR